ncbi:MAG: flavin-containing monooxygenase [Pseudomonadales bacterium]
MNSSHKESSNLGFDPNALRVKYRAERDKRVRPEGVQQYIVPTGALAHFIEDPNADPSFSRSPVDEAVDVAIVGAGFGGLLAGARLREAGLEDLRIIDAGGDFGGTWYWNNYPGVQCDIESYCYIPLLEELGYMPKEKYALGAEIFAHSQRIARHYDLYPCAYFHTKVTDLTWDEATARWTVSTDRGDTIRARFVVMASGFLSQPKLPAIPGIEKFGGRIFHTSRWDYDYTGGDTNGNLTKLGDKRVALVGTGATAIQCTPFLGEYAEHVYVIQRTPSSVDLRGNAPTDVDWVSSLTPGWQRRRRDNFSDIVIGLPVEEDLVNDAWSSMFKELESMLPPAESGDISPEEAAELAELADFKKMNAIRARVDADVSDHETAEKLKPWYRQFCKRPTFSDVYLPTFNRENVTLVDASASQGVERVTPNGLVTGGVEYEVDCIIFSTGFTAGGAFTETAGFEVHGQNGQSLTEKWADGLKTLHGFSAHGFPNCYKMGLGQNGLSVNITAMLEDQAQHIAYIINELTKRGARYAQPTLEAEQQWVDTINEFAFPNIDFFEACTPGYYNNEGQPDQRGFMNAEGYGPGINAFNALLARWRADGDLAGLELR